MPPRNLIRITETRHQIIKGLPRLHVAASKLIKIIERMSCAEGPTALYWHPLLPFALWLCWWLGRAENARFSEDPIGTERVFVQFSPRTSVFRVGRDWMGLGGGNNFPLHLHSRYR